MIKIYIIKKVKKMENFEKYEEKLRRLELVKKFNSKKLGNIIIIAALFGIQHISFSFYTS